MANIKVCDLCLQEDKGYVKSTHRYGFKGGFKLDLCTPHVKAKPFAGLTQDEAMEKYLAMGKGKTRVA